MPRAPHCPVGTEEVVLDDVALGPAPVGKQHLVRAGNPNDPAGDFDVEIGHGTEAIQASRYPLPASRQNVWCRQGNMI
jgi:hypothetical protein